ncbi:MAG: MFS transporter [Bacteroidales bacterium]|nr:MFS transporter [Bacteroidales bacterium]
MNKFRQFFPLYFTNIFGVMNDNVLKALVCFVAATWVEPEYQAIIVNCMAAAMVVPYVLFSPLAGKLPHFFRKKKIVKIAKMCEIPIMLVAMLGFYFQNIALAMTAVLLMGLQSALFSPAKYGLIKDIGGEEGISMGMGGMEAFAFLGMLIGTFVGSIMSDHSSLTLYAGVLFALAIAGFLSSLTIKAEEVKSCEESSANPIKFIRESSAIVKRYKGLNQVIMLLSLFWWFCASVQIILILHCNSYLHISNTHTGYMLATMAVGITTGCLLGGRLNQNRYMLGQVPRLGLIAGVLMIIVFVLPFDQMGEYRAWYFGFFMTVIAIIVGIFKIPLDAEIQKRVSASELNVILAYFNLISFIFILSASLTNILITKFLSTTYVFLFDGLILMAWSFYFLMNYKGSLCYRVRNIIRTHYDIKLNNKEVLDVPEGQNLLILPMHRALIDPLILFAELYDYKLQPMVDARFWNNKLLGHVLDLFDAVKVPDLRRGGREGVEQVQKLDGIVKAQLENGANIIFYPSGHITLDGKETIGTRRMAHNASKVLPDHTRVVAIETHGLWGSRWSNYGRTHTTPMMPMLFKSVKFLMLLRFLFVPKREVNIRFTDITKDFREWSALPRQQFNAKMEEFYNRVEDKLVLTKI